MFMKFAIVLFVAFIVHYSLAEVAPITPSSGEAVSGETAPPSGRFESTEQAPTASTDSSISESSAETEGNASTISKLQINNDPSVKQDSANPETTGPPEAGDNKGVQETEITIQKRDVSSEPPKENEISESETNKPAEAEDLAVSTVEPNKTCIISNQTHWSWLVKILDKETGKQVCTGTLITDEDILVPASCFMENTTQEVPESFYMLPTEIMAIAGGGANTDCMQVRNISVIYPHKGYFDNSEEHDYAFLKVSPEFDVDDDDIPDIRYHLNVINSEGGLVNIHNNGPFCESPYFVDDGMNAKVSDEIHLLGMRIEDCMMIWNCSADFDTCLSYLHPASHACLKPLTPRNCSSRDKGAPLVCDDVFLGYLHQCDGELPMIFRGLNKAIKFLELEDDHVQRPGYLGRHY